jgi:hypothetical protein
MKPKLWGRATIHWRSGSIGCDVIYVSPDGKRVTVVAPIEREFKAQQLETGEWKLPGTKGCWITFK